MRTFLSRYGLILLVAVVALGTGLGLSAMYTQYQAWAQIQILFPQVVQALTAHEQTLRQLTGKPTVGIADAPAPAASPAADPPPTTRP